MLSVQPSVAVGPGVGGVGLHNSNDSFVGGSGTNSTRSGSHNTTAGGAETTRIKPLGESSMIGITSAVVVVCVATVVCFTAWCYRRAQRAHPPKRNSVSDDIHSQVTDEAAATGTSKFPADFSRQLSTGSSDSAGSTETTTKLERISLSVGQQNKRKVLDVTSIPSSPHSRSGVVSAVNPVSGLVRREVQDPASRSLTVSSPSFAPESLMRPRKLQPLQAPGSSAKLPSVAVPNVLASLSAVASPKPPVQPQLSSPNLKVLEYSSSPLRRSSVHDIDDDVTKGVEKAVVSPTVIMPQFQRRPVRRSLVPSGDNLASFVRFSASPEGVQTLSPVHRQCTDSALDPPAGGKKVVPIPRNPFIPTPTEVVTESPLATMSIRQHRPATQNSVTTVWQGVSPARTVPSSTSAPLRNPAYGVCRPGGLEPSRPVANLTTSLEGLLRPRRMPASQRVCFRFLCSR
jgi:hypothetical protein